MTNGEREGLDHGGEWTSRPVAAFAVRALAVVLPIAAGTVAARLTSSLFDPSATWWSVVAVSLAAGVAVSMIVARLAMWLLPLALLLKMTMIFPDRAPSRAKVARRHSSKQELAARLADRDADARDAAEALLELVTALGRHDRKTRGHSERVRLYCDLLGTELKLTPAEHGRLRWVGLLHDVGKLEVAAEILNKPTKLDDEEWHSVHAHPDAGARLAEPLREWLGQWHDGIRDHHEKFDGSGYPRGLAGNQISLAGRVISVVDAFETMTAARSYKAARTSADARAELTRCAGDHFDPAIVRAFLRIALPRLVWAMGPLTFLINVPWLRWVPTASVRAADVTAAGVAGASGAVSATAVTAVVLAAPAVAQPQSHDAAPLATYRTDRHAAATVRHDGATVAPVQPQRSTATSTAGGSARPAFVRPGGSTPGPASPTVATVVLAGAASSSSAESSAAPSVSASDGAPSSADPSLGSPPSVPSDPASSTPTGSATPEPTTEPGRGEAPTSNGSTTDPPKSKAPKSKAPKSKAPKSKAPKSKAPKSKAPKSKAPKTKAPKTDPPKADPPKAKAPKSDPPKADPPKADPPKTDPPKANPPKTKAPKTDAPRSR